jgi:hypothetical protein
MAPFSELLNLSKGERSSEFSKVSLDKYDPRKERWSDHSHNLEVPLDAVRHPPSPRLVLLRLNQPLDPLALRVLIEQSPLFPPPRPHHRVPLLARTPERKGVLDDLGSLPVEDEPGQVREELGDDGRSSSWGESDEFGDEELGVFGLDELEEAAFELDGDGFALLLASVLDDL